MRRDAVAKLDNLVYEAQDFRGIRRNQVGIGGRAAISKVVGEQRGGVELGGEEADPVQTATSRPSRQRWVAERVTGGRLGSRDVEPGLGIGVAASDGLDGHYAAIRGVLDLITYKVIRYFAASLGTHWSNSIVVSAQPVLQNYSKRERVRDRNMSR